MSERIYIVAAKRTPLSRFLGVQAHLGAVRLGSHAARAALLQSGLDGADLDSVITGVSLTAGQSGNIARRIALDADISEDIPASNVQMGALSGMKAIIDACAQIKAGDADLILTIGCDSPSSSGFLHSAALRHGHPHGHLETLDLLLCDADPMSGRADDLARRYRLSRQWQDTFALASRQNAKIARENGHFAGEISATDITSDHILDLSAEHLAKFPALHGTITAGNRAAPADGASAIVLASHSALRRFALMPLAEVAGYGMGGIHPDSGALAAVSAIAQALERSGHRLADMARLEIEESHAADVLAIVHELAGQHDTTYDALHERLNPSGGALALGHSLACAGHRLTTTLTYALARHNLSLGLAAQGSGDGLGAALILQR